MLAYKHNWPVCTIRRCKVPMPSHALACMSCAISIIEHHLPFCTLLRLCIRVLLGAAIIAGLWVPILVRIASDSVLLAAISPLPTPLAPWPPAWAIWAPRSLLRP